MSRLDSFIRRLEAQRACLNMAASLVRGVDGAVLELGLGNGRTYDHLRQLFPERDIFVCERQIAAHPDCIPPERIFAAGRHARNSSGGAPAVMETDCAGAFRPRNRRCRGKPGAGQGIGADGGAAACGPAALLSARWRSESSGVGLDTLCLPASAPGRYHVYRRGQLPIVTMTGTWSEAFAQLRLSRNTRASVSSATIPGVAQI